MTVLGVIRNAESLVVGAPIESPPGVCGRRIRDRLRCIVGHDSGAACVRRAEETILNRTAW